MTLCHAPFGANKLPPLGPRSVQKHFARGCCHDQGTGKALPACIKTHPSGTQGSPKTTMVFTHSSTAVAFFGSCRYFRWSSRASFVSNNWLLTGDLNFPVVLIPTF